MSFVEFSSKLQRETEAARKDKADTKARTPAPKRDFREEDRQPAGRAVALALLQGKISSSKTLIDILTAS